MEKYWTTLWLLCTGIVAGIGVTQASINQHYEWGIANLKRFCEVFIPLGDYAAIPCLNFSNDTDSAIYWSLVTPDGSRTLDIGHCSGPHNCQSPLSPEFVVDSSSRARSTLVLHNYSGERAWSRLICTVSQFGRNYSDSCYPAFQQVIEDDIGSSSTATRSSSTTTRSTTDSRLRRETSSYRSTASTERPKTGNVTFNAHCSFPDMDRIGCHIDSDDPQSSVLWSLITPEGLLRSLGHCVGLRGVCQTTRGAGISLSRRYSWSVATLRNSSEFAGSSIVCTASHRGVYRADLCRLGDPTVEVRDCIRGRDACESRGWQRNTGSINGVAVCCSPRADNLGLSIVVRYRDHPCLCPS